jgi:hypothetical protein
MNASPPPPLQEILPQEIERPRSRWVEAVAAVRNLHCKDVALMLNYRRIALWLMVLLVPGGVLLLPLLIADMRQRRLPKQIEQQNHEIASDHPMSGVAA